MPQSLINNVGFFDHNAIAFQTDNEVELDSITMRTQEPRVAVSTLNNGPKRTLSNYTPHRTRAEPEVFQAKRSSRSQDLNTFVDTSLSV